MNLNERDYPHLVLGTWYIYILTLTHTSGKTHSREKRGLYLQLQNAEWHSKQEDWLAHWIDALMIKGKMTACVNLMGVFLGSNGQMC